MLNLKLGLSGEYRMRVYKSKSGMLVRDTGWFDNLILDSGLDHIGLNFSSSAPRHTRYIAVGTDSTVPATTDTQLGSEVARVDSGTSVTSTTIDSVDRFVTIQRTASFLNGAAEGNLAEVGASRFSSAAGGTLFSRSQIKDSNGDPTTVTVLADEDLVVDYRYRVKQPTGGFSGSVPSTTINYTGDIYGADSTAFWGAGGAEAWIETGNVTGFDTDTVLRSITDTAAPSANQDADSKSFGTYSTGTFQITVELFFDTGSANQDNTWLLLMHNMFSFQILFDTATTKTDTDTLRVGYTVSWGRHTP